MKHTAPVVTSKRACLQCGETIDAHADRRRLYCSKQCKVRAAIARHYPPKQPPVDCCVECNTPLPVPHYANKRYCSTACKCRALYRQKHPQMRTRKESKVKESRRVFMLRWQALKLPTQETGS